VLAEGWRIDAAALRYAPVGGGSYHWVVRDGAGRRWFVTADDLDDKAWLGHTRPVVMAGLRSAMETALALRRDAGLDFVHRLRSAHGRTADAEHAWVALKQTVTSLGGETAAWAINC
jgi:spectinomycin phosphotransferase